MAPGPQDGTSRRPLNPEDLYHLRLAGDPQVSPDGRRALYVVQSFDREQDEINTEIWITDLGGPEGLQGSGGTGHRRLTAGPKDRLPRWSPDGRRIAFISDRTGKAQLWIIDPDGGEAWHLATPQRLGSPPVWSPDSRCIAYHATVFDHDESWRPYPGAPEGDRLRAAAHSRPVETGPSRDRGAGDGGQDAVPGRDIRVITRLKYRFDGIGYFGDRRSHIFVVDVPAGPGVGGGGSAGPRQVTGGDFDHHQPAWTPDGRYLVFVAVRRPDADHLQKADLWAAEVESGRLFQVLDSDGMVMAPRVAPDGRWIAYLGHDGRRGGSTTNQIFIVPFEPSRKEPAGQGEAVSLTAHLDRPAGATVGSDTRYVAEMFIPPQWGDEPGTLYTLVCDQGISDIYRLRFDPADPTDPVGRLESRAVTPGGRVVAAFSVGRGGTAVYQAGESHRPDDLYVQAPAGESRRLTALNDDLLAGTALSRAESFTCTGADGWSIEGWYMKPAGDTQGQPVPTVLFIHGGPHGVYGPAFQFQFQLFAGRGYAVVFMNPRGSQGYGQDFAGAVVEDWGGKDYVDLMAGVDHVVEAGLADPERLAVTGWSYGGYMTNWVVSQTDRFRAACTGACVFNRHNFWGTSDIGHNFGGHHFGGTPWEEPEKLLSRSAVRFADRIRTPLLILHGENDHRCPIEQAEQLFTALKVLGREAVFVRYPGQFHALVKPSHREDRFARMVAWFNHHLQVGRP